MNHGLLNDIVIIFGLAVLVGLICHRTRVPKVVGFLLTGLVTGPHGLRLVGAVAEVDALAEIGIVLLLFTIGIEFSFKNMLRIRRSVLLGGSIQVGLTVLATALLARALERTVAESVFFGFLVALSSTAIVLRLLQERAEVDAPHGRTSLAILIFQDLIVVPMMLIIPLLGREAGEGLLQTSLLLIAKGVAILLLVAIAARWVVPELLFQIARTGSRELFLLTVFLLCFSVAWMTSALGLSLALGAFLAGLIISESEYSHQTLSDILPFRDVFTSFFFVSIGMLLDTRFLMEHPLLLGLGCLIIMVLKGSIAGATAGLLGFPVRTMILAGLALSQIGEFSFILAKSGVDHGLLLGREYQSFLAVSILSMAVTPFVISMGPRFANAVARWPLTAPWGAKAFSPAQPEDVRIRDHLVIAGFGVNGRNLARAARAAGIPYVIIEMNPETVRTERAKGEPIHYGDASNAPVLRHAHLDRARVLVVAINDPAAIRGIVETARKLNPRIHIIVRTRYVQEVQPLYALGVNEVIPEEFETAVEIFSRVLKRYLVPEDEIQKLVAEVRADTYEILRSLPLPSASVCDLETYLHDLEVSALRVEADSPMEGRSLADVELRKRHGVTVVAIRRGQESLINPDPHLPIQRDDVLVMIARAGRISDVVPLVRTGGQEGGTQ